MLTAQAAQLTQLFSRLMRQLFTLDPGNSASELPLAQLRVCSILRDGSRTVSALARELNISVSAVTQIADRLERSGMVDRISETDDRRVKSLQLTPLGEEVMRLHREHRVRRAAQALGRLTPDMRRAALEVLNALLEASLATAVQVSSETPPAAEFGD